MKTNSAKKKMAIIASYFPHESFGLLGPQMAATIIEENTAYECAVIGVTRNDKKETVLKALTDFFAGAKPVIGYTYLAGREDLFDLAGETTRRGATTILAGPQAEADFMGEVGSTEHPHRFQGLSKNFTYALAGPAEQLIPLLDDPGGDNWKEAPGFLHRTTDGSIAANGKKPWEDRFLKRIKWDNIYSVGEGGLTKIEISSGQVLRRIGCPYAATPKAIEVDYPAFMTEEVGRKITIVSRGCDFCDVAVDKGDHMTLQMETVIRQIQSLPTMDDGRKVPFELIDERPLTGLSPLLDEVNARGIRLSMLSLIMRADWLLKGEKPLREALDAARRMGVSILLASVGFESFDDAVLENLNKGLDVETNLLAVRLMRTLKQDFPDVWGYANFEGALHGLIHPTPWDTKESWANMLETMAIHGLPNDVLPAASAPLVIHHASALGEWIRQIELERGVRFRRLGSIIAWWEQPSQA